MKTNVFSSLRITAAFLVLFLFMLLPAQHCSAQYGGRLVSATPQTPITLGQPLYISILVSNSTDYVWEVGTDFYPFSWLTELNNAAWKPDLDHVEASFTTVQSGATDSMLVWLDPVDLPSQPGTYQLDVLTVWNWFDVQLSLMDNCPYTLTFTISGDAGPSNTPPVITAIGNKTAIEGTPLTFQAVATDTNTPAQTLTWSLLPGAPSGASINSANGVFTWSPPTGATPRTNQISVRVTDNGSPPMSATNTFQVVVMKPLRFLPVPLPTNNLVRLSWESYLGRTYRLRYRTNLTTAPWLNLGNDIVATASTTTATNSTTTGRQRYYQVLMLE